MNFNPPRLLACCAVATVLAAVFSAAAQQTILFSKPTESPEEQANSFMPSLDSRLQGRAGQFNAPKQLFNLSPQDSDLPPPQMPQLPNPSLKDELDRRRNWTLMTPQEILGVPTPEKILGLPDPTGDDKRSVTERYLRRQDLAAAVSATNAMRQPGLSLLRDDDNPFAPKRQRDLTNPGGENDTTANMAARPDQASRKFFDRLVTAPASSPFAPDQTADSTWSSAFNQPAPQVKPNLDQVAAMDRFRALMEPSAPPASAPTTTRFAPAPLPVPDPNLQPLPVFNPLGQSFSALQNDIGRPKGINPLPGLTGPYVAPPASKKSQVQLPPWLLKDPQPPESPFSPFNTQRW
jgi:hypothetical protein